MSFSQLDPLLASNKMPSSTSASFSGKKISPSTMQEVISMLKKQLRECKYEREEQRQSHKQQVTKLTKQIDSLRQKILQMKQKQYLKTILTQDAEQQKMKQASLSNTNKKLKVYVQKLENDLKFKEQQIQKLKEEKMDLNNDKQVLLKQKQKHLELSIIEKINLEERIKVLQKQIQSKQNFLNALKQQGAQSTNKEIQLKKLQRKLVKKVNQVQQYEEELKNFKQFQTQKLKTRIQTLQKQNTFLKQHISKIQEQFTQTNQCICSSTECKKEIDLFKNKYINKSRQLSKVKVELSKQMFKEQFLKDVKNKENLSMEHSRTKGGFQQSKSSYKQKMTSNCLDSSKKLQTSKDQQNDDVLFKLTQNDQDSFSEEKTLPTYSLSKYKSDILKRKQSKPLGFR